MINQEDKKQENKEQDTSPEEKDVIIIDDYIKRENPYKNLKVPKAERFGVAIIDCSSVETIEERENQIVKGSHLAMVKSAVDESVPIIEVYESEMTDAPDTVDHKKFVKAVKNIIKTHEETGVRVVNLSFGSSISISELNDLIKRFKPEEDVILTRENIGNYSEVLKSAFKNMQKQHPADVKNFKEINESVDLIEDLISKDIIVISGAGNSGENEVDLLSCFVPDVVVVGGLNGKQPHESSSNSSLVDAWAPFVIELSLEIEDGKVIEGEKNHNNTIETKIRYGGTSVCAPQLIDEVIDLQKQGFKASQINEVLRTRSSYQFGKETNKVILVDLNKSLIMLYSSPHMNKLEDVRRFLTISNNKNNIAFIDSAIESKQAINLKEALDIAQKIIKETKEPIIKKQDLVKAFRAYSKDDK